MSISPKKTLFVIALFSLLQSLSILILPDFYLKELIEDLRTSDPFYLHIKILLICCATLGISSSVVIYAASTLELSQAKVILKGVAIFLIIIFLLLIGLMLLTPFKLPLFLLFSTGVLSLFSIICCRKN